MYQTPKYSKTSIEINQGFEGETIEQRMERIVNNGEPITDGSPNIYTEREEGVRPETNIRTDRFDRALEAKDKIDADALTKRAEKLKELAEKRKPKTEENNPDQGKNDGKAEPTQGTTGNQNSN